MAMKCLWGTESVLKKAGDGIEFGQLNNASLHILIRFFACTGNEAVIDDNCKAEHVSHGHVIWCRTSRKLDWRRSLAYDNYSRLGFSAIDAR